MIRVISLNLNGIRSAARKGLADWVSQQAADVICVQELKAQLPDIEDSLREIDGLTGHFHCAEKKGYSGVGIYTRRKPVKVIHGLGHPEFDAEGRFLEADYGRYSVVSLYLPSGTSGDERLAFKYRFMDVLMAHLEKLFKSGREIIVCGDWNIAHQQIDLKNWRSNQKNSGFLPEERAWLSDLFDRVGYVDVFRRLDQREEQYTWWSNRGQAWAKNVGWRLDYHVATPGIAGKAKETAIYTDDRFSDHAPLTIDYAVRR
ncbi:MAG: exodeoxyribonuclease III [Burkholderiaceae bacterium]